jgi:hypothetical protein
MKSLFVVSIIALTLFIVYTFQAKKDDTYFGTTTLSNLRIESKMGQERLDIDPVRPTIIIWFHPDCENCRYQLNTINGNIEKFSEVRFFLITADTNFFKNNYGTKWPDLAQSSYVYFGIIDKSKFINEFGPVVAPSLLLFNRRGILKEKLYGEVKVEKIIHLINNITVPEQTMSGYK